MPRNSTTDLTNHIFEQIERLKDEDCDLDREIRVSKVVVQLSAQAIEIEKLRFQKAAFLIDRGYDADEDYQKMLDT